MNTKKILLIDYDPASISKTVTPLTRAGYTVEVAKDGVSGLQAFDRIRPSLVLVEAMLPRKHGFEVCKEIKAKPDAHKTPVLITTAVCRGQKYRTDAVQMYGCDEYIEKPIPDDDLVSMVDRLIEQAAQAHSDIRQELSQAIDQAVPKAATPSTASPSAIESMSDDELDAQIDSMLLGPPPAKTEASAPAVEPKAPAPVEAPAAGEVESPDPEPHTAAVLTDDEPEAAEPPIPENQPALPAAPKTKPLTQTEPFASAPLDASPRRRPKALLLAIAAAAVVGVAGFLALQQDWFGGDPAPIIVSEPTPGPSAQTSPIPHTYVAVDSSDLDGPAVSREQPSINEPTDTIEPAPAAIDAVPPNQSDPGPKPVLPPKPAVFKGRSAATRQAALDRQRRAEEALFAAAGSLKNTLLSDIADEPSAIEDRVNAVDIDETMIGVPVRPQARRGQLIDIGDVDRVPVALRFEQPAYDELSRRKREQGEIRVAVLIDETGTVVETRIERGIPGSRLNGSSLRAAQDWVYRPAVKDGVPVRVWKTERIVFALE